MLSVHVSHPALNQCTCLFASEMACFHDHWDPEHWLGVSVFLQVGVPRIPRLIPILSVIPSQGQQGEALHPDQATNPWQAQGPLASHQQQMQAGVPGQATGASANTTGHRTRPAHMKAAAARSR
jgi:hypothetical protein